MSSNQYESWSSRGGWPDQPPQYSQGGRGSRRGQGLWEDDYQPRYASRRRGKSWKSGGPRRGRKARRLVALVVTLAVVAAVLVIGDNVARGYAQNLIASKIQSSSGLASKPAVSIKGTPFLTQVLERDVRQVDISARNVRRSTLVIESIQATALGVHLNSSFKSATIDTINGTGLIPFGSLVSQIGVKGVTLAADPSAGANSAKITVSSLSALGVSLGPLAGLAPAGPLSGVAKITQSGPSTITIHTESLGSFPVSQLGSAGDFTIHVPKLPLRMSLTGVSVTPQGVSVRVAAHDTTLSGSSGLSG